MTLWLRRRIRVVALLSFLVLGRHVACAGDQVAEYRLATFSVDVTIPLGHRCMGVLPTKSRKIVDRLYAHGCALRGPDSPIVLCAVDWCEIRNGA